MAPFRGRGGRVGNRGSRGNRGGRGGGRGKFHGASNDNGRLARSGIRTRNGYKKFDSQRTRELSESEDDGGHHEILSEEENTDEHVDINVSDDENVEDSSSTVRAYSALLQSFKNNAEPSERSSKRRKLETPSDSRGESIVEDVADDESGGESDEQASIDDSGEVYVDASEEPTQEDDLEDEPEDSNSDDLLEDPYEHHFVSLANDELSTRLNAAQAGRWNTEKLNVADGVCARSSLGDGDESFRSKMKKISSYTDLSLKERLAKTAEKHISIKTELEKVMATNLFSYTDILVGNRSVQNAATFRSFACLHAMNHVLKGRDKVLKNNERLSHADNAETLEFRDQGFVRPKILILCETRQMAAKYANTIATMFQPDQQENRQRFDDSFTTPIDNRDNMPEDFRELFDGNNDNSFLTALKFTRKTMKFYSAFYNSDIILASPLGLRRVIENEDQKKRDYDFLSSIEIAVADQTDAMQMQNWENVEVVFKHMNLQLKEAHGCDFSRVRNWYLDGNARYLRQTIVLSAYITPEMNRLYNTSMLNIAGKVKLAPNYPGAIADLTGLGIKQTFSRFECISPASDPDARFKYFTTAVLPSLLRLPKPADGAQGVLIFIPSYFDFLRLRNYFATSSVTENISFGAIHDYSEVSEQRRARSHFLSGRHSILLYTQRAHHFFRLKLRGVKRIVMYGAPDNEIFYREFVEGFLGTSISEGKISEREASMRGLFARWDGMKMERIVGTARVRNMLSGVGDTFDFL